VQGAKGSVEEENITTLCSFKCVFSRLLNRSWQHISQ